MPNNRVVDQERAAALRREEATAESAAADAGQAQHPLLALQRQIGNAQVARMLAQRASATADEEQAAPEVGPAGGPISAGLASRIESQRGRGSALDAGARAEMQGHFGTSFADVRVHTDRESDALNHSVGATAFTTGNDIFFRNDASPSDSGLLAHELTHVVQQRSMSHSGGATVGAADDAYEHEANAVSAAIGAGKAATAQRTAAPEEEDQAG